jgi:hypothetical protein
MTLLNNVYRIISEWRVESLSEFLNEPQWYEAFCKRYPEYHDNDDFDIHAQISSDMCEIQAMLDADHKMFTVDCLDDGGYTYFLIREWEKVSEQ